MQESAVRAELLEEVHVGVQDRGELEQAPGEEDDSENVGGRLRAGQALKQNKN